MGYCKQKRFGYLLPAQFPVQVLCFLRHHVIIGNALLRYKIALLSITIGEREI